MLINLFRTNLNFKSIKLNVLDVQKRTFGDSFYYIRGLLFIFFIDACVTDDEPI